MYTLRNKTVFFTKWKSNNNLFILTCKLNSHISLTIKKSAFYIITNLQNSQINYKTVLIILIASICTDSSYYVTHQSGNRVVIDRTNVRIDDRIRRLQKAILTFSRTQSLWLRAVTTIIPPGSSWICFSWTFSSWPWSASSLSSRPCSLSNWSSCSGICISWCWFVLVLVMYEAFRYLVVLYVVCWKFSGCGLIIRRFVLFFCVHLVCLFIIYNGTRGVFARFNYFVVLCIFFIQFPTVAWIAFTSTLRVDIMTMIRVVVFPPWWFLCCRHYSWHSRCRLNSPIIKFLGVKIDVFTIIMIPIHSKHLVIILFSLVISITVIFVTTMMMMTFHGIFY